MVKRRLYLSKAVPTPNIHGYLLGTTWVWAWINIKPPDRVFGVGGSTPYTQYPLFLGHVFGNTRISKINTNPFFSRGSTSYPRRRGCLEYSGPLSPNTRCHFLVGIMSTRSRYGGTLIKRAFTRGDNWSGNH